MPRYIDADALYVEVTEKYRDITAGSYPFNIVAYDMARLVENTPTADVEQVVYCKDCACVRAVHMGNKFVYRCPMSTVDVEPEGYCSRGVRRNEDLGRS